MLEPKKLLIAGVGGQGVVFLTNIITEAALLADIPVASSEIHGLAQRRGSVISGITLGSSTFGYIEEAGADYMIGLEPMEAQRCFRYLSKSSQVVIDNNQIYPHSVNAGNSDYPDIEAFVKYLRQNIKAVTYNLEFVEGMKPVLRNIYMLGRATNLDVFPIQAEFIEQAIEKIAREEYRSDSLEAFRLGRLKG